MLLAFNKLCPHEAYFSLMVGSLLSKLHKEDPILHVATPKTGGNKNKPWTHSTPLKQNTCILLYILVWNSFFWPIYALWPKWKSRFRTCPCHKIYRVEAVCLSNHTLKITIFVNMLNVRQFRENLMFCQKKSLCKYMTHIIVIIWPTPHFAFIQWIFI